MIFIKTTRSHPFPNNKYDNYYYNRLFKTLKYIILRPSRLTFLELLISGFSPMEI